MKNKNRILIGLGILLLLQCCQHDDSPKPDPCAGLKPTTADFTVVVIGPTVQGWLEVPSDTLFWLPYVKFTALQDSAAGTTYTWQIGADTYHTRTVKLSFGTRPLDLQNILVALSVVRQPDRTCFPMDSGNASSVKNIYFENDFTRLPFLGSFKGAFNGYLTDTATITITYDPTTLRPGDTLAPPHAVMHIYNIDGHASNDYISYNYFSYNEVILNGLNGHTLNNKQNYACINPVIISKSYNQFIITYDYEYYDFNKPIGQIATPLGSVTFTGYRMQ